MTKTRLISLIILTVYTLFASITFWLAREYPFAGVYSIWGVVLWFKIYQYGKRKQQA
jgi:hypothetical protein